MKFKIFLLSVFFSVSSYAGVICEGKIERLGVSPVTGEVHLQIEPSTNIFRICDLDATVGQISAESCSAMYSTLLTARASGQVVSYHFPNGFSCASLGGWDYPSSQPSFFEMQIDL